MEKIYSEEMIELPINDLTRSIHMAMAVFEDLISPDELRFFRGVIINLSDNNPLFHNHVDIGYRYSYPKVQYKLFEGHPAVLGLEEGADAVMDLFAGMESLQCRLGHYSRELHLSSLADWHDEIGISGTQHTYCIENWLPLNSRNFKEYREAEGLIGQLALLQKILTGNLLSFAKGVGLFFDRRIKCMLEDIRTNDSTGFKGLEFMEFSAVFKTDVLLPQWIGLGKSASLNHGIILKQ
ncbi:MAG: hypothetical protein K2G77_03315 [Muribaculaceae bacterium]|nr:hypothetical protein [Muribaculaceae bacterium]